MNAPAKVLRSAALFMFAAVTVGCGTMYSGKPHLTEVGALQPNELVLVGRIELVPPLSAEEQELKTLTSDRFQGRAAAIFSDRLFDLNNLPMSTGSHSILVDLGKDFYTRQPRSQTLLYSGSIILTKSAAYSSGYMGRNVTVDTAQIKLPGGLKYALKADDRAVYVGTLRYHRDDYNTITKVEIVDDYAKANKAFKAKFGTSLKLRKAKAESMK